MNVNTMGMLNVTSAISPLMAGQKCGHFVNISSVCLSYCFLLKNENIELILQGKSVIENHVVSGAGKYFIEGFSQGLRREGLSDGIKVCDYFRLQCLLACKDWCLLIGLEGNFLKGAASP